MRSKRAYGLVLTLTIVVACGKAFPQRAAASGSLTGTVTGTVYADEGRTPLRFADITLYAVGADVQAIADRETYKAGASRPPSRVTDVTGRSGLDGTFRLEGVPVGDYIVGAGAPGFVTAGARSPSEATGEQVRAALAALPQIHVGPMQTAVANVILHRGGVITGQARYPDGTPAARLRMSAEPKETATAQTSNSAKKLNLREHALELLAANYTNPKTATTDDEGRYRIMGLPPGEYTVSASFDLVRTEAFVQMTVESSDVPRRRIGMVPESVLVFAPGVFTRKQSTVIAIKDNERVTGIDIDLDTQGLHSVRGKVRLTDRRSPGGFVLVKLTEAHQDSRYVGIADDGSFEVHYLPAGTYDLEIDAENGLPAPPPASGANQPAEPEPPREYKKLQSTFVMGDHDVVLDEMTTRPLKPGETNPASLFPF